MPYITAEEYTGLTGADPPSDFDQLNALSTVTIDNLTLLGLIGRDIDAMPGPIQDRVKLAAALQVQYLDGLGGMDGANADGITSATLGRYSYTVDAGAAAETGSATPTSPLIGESLSVVRAYLRGLRHAPAP